MLDQQKEKSMKAEYKCKKCHYEWKAIPDTVECPKCHHFYIKWVNYEKMKLSGFK